MAERCKHPSHQRSRRSSLTDNKTAERLIALCLPQKSQELANGYSGLGEFPYPHYPHATSNGHSIGGLGGNPIGPSRDTGYGTGLGDSRLGDSRQGSGAWLQSGLGVSVGSGSGQLGSMSDLWGRSNKLSPSPSIWASQRLDADVVPEPLQVSLPSSLVKPASFWVHLHHSSSSQINTSRGICSSYS